MKTEKTEVTTTTTDEPRRDDDTSTTVEHTQRTEIAEDGDVKREHSTTTTRTERDKG